MIEAVKDSTALFDVVSPATGRVVASVPDQGVSEARACADRAAAAFIAWRAETAFARSALLRKWFDAILADRDNIARLIASEMGKAVSEARGEVTYAASFVEWYAEEAKRVYGETVPSQFAHKRLMVMHQPVGPVYAITPWNFPAGMVTRKVAPALAAGCTVILKPAEESPLTALRLAELWRQAGGPADVLQLLTTSDPVSVTRVFMADARIRKVAFTGSTAVGARLYAESAPGMKRISLELGGHAPFIVFDDAELDGAVREVIATKFRNSGQTCVCANRIFVHERVHDAFVTKLVAVVEKLRVGDPLDEATQIGPLVNAAALAKVREHVSDALAGGAKVATGGSAKEGLWFTPTVLTGVRAGMQIMREETFGPVAPVISFSDETAVIAAANDVEFGLAAYIWTADLSRAFRVTEALDYGIVGVNDGLPATAQAPFGGMKMSGLGREGGKWGLDEYLEVKYVSIALQK